MDSITAFSALTNLNPILVALVLVWSLVWKGLALWRSAQLSQKYWFIALLIINTLGILEIIYLFIISRKYQVEIVKENQ
jgi:hypothetical protein